MEMEEAKDFNSSSSSSSCNQEVAKGQRTKRRRAPPPPPPPPPGPTSSSASSAEFSSSITEEDEDMANCLVLLSRGRNTLPSARLGPSVFAYECRTCSKRFPSFQALGGHRASHKKPKPTAAPEEITSSDFSKQPPPPPPPRVHECAICGSEFSSGQALGGHMRRHRPNVTVAAAALTEVTKKERISAIPLDLNLPAPDDHHHDDHGRQQLGFTIVDGQQPIVFSAAPLVDCQH